MKKLLLILAVLIFSITVCIGAVAWLLTSPIQMKSGAMEVSIDVPRGGTLKGAIKAMDEKGLLRYAAFHEVVAKVIARKTGKALQRGRFHFYEGQTHLEAIISLFKIQTLKATFPEGISLEDFAHIAQSKIGCDSTDFMKLCLLPQTLEKYGVVGVPSMEGYLMPDTYEFIQLSNAQEVLHKLAMEHKRTWETQFAALQRKQKFTKQEILTLASIIEAETPSNDEKPRVSGVYHNRLQRGIRLQANPTVQYAIGEKRRVLFKDLEIDHPYNTYKIVGLPPSPINSPGRAAIAAALQPEKHSYLYFVARGDGSNRHIFSKSNSQHSQAVSKYYRERRRQKVRQTD